MRKPIVRVIGQTGADLVPGWAPALESITYTDNEGGEADELEVVFSVAPPFPAPPEKGTRYRLHYGWADDRLRDAGLFTFQHAALERAAGDGWTMTIVARSADFVDADKSADHGHYEDTTVGAILVSLARQAGKQAIVDAAISAVKIPYRLRLGQSPLGFAQSLVDELGATLKLADGKWIVPAKGAARTAAGTALPVIAIAADRLIDCGLSSEGRPDYKTVETSHFDTATGMPVTLETAGSGKAARAAVLHPSASAGEAELRGKAEVTDLARATIAGSLTVEGDVAAMAGAPVALAGFGAWAGTDLTAGLITHTFTFDDGGGWLMTVELAAKTNEGA